MTDAADSSSTLDTAPPAIDLKRTRRTKTAPAPAARLDRLPPHSLEAEQGVLGCILLAPSDGIGLCLQKIKSGAEVFYDLRHQTLFTTMVAMYDQLKAVDPVTLGQWLKDRSLLDAVGGYAYLSLLMDAVPSAANLEYYVEIVREKALLRKMIQTCTNVIARAYEEPSEVERLMDEVERDVLRIGEERLNSGVISIKETVKKAFARVEEYQQNPGKMNGLGTGFADLDNMTTGLHGGEMIVIAARPSMGKTSLAMNIAEFVAVEQQLPVGVFSLEMAAESLVLRMMCSRARLNLHGVRSGGLGMRDSNKLTSAASKLASAPLFIDDTASLSVLQLRARARRMSQQSGIKLFVIDYLQLVHSTAARADQNRQQEIADISGGIKALAKELDVPVIVLSQLNREVERDKGRKPRLSDLRESGAIEQDADLVGLLYKADPGNPKKPSGGEDDDNADEADAGPVNLYIAKQRNGPTGDVHLTFFRSITRFESAARIPDDAAS